MIINEFQAENRFLLFLFLRSIENCFHSQHDDSQQLPDNILFQEQSNTFERKKKQSIHLFANLNHFICSRNQIESKNDQQNVISCNFW